MSERERPSEEKKTELIQEEAQPPTLDISEAARTEPEVTEPEPTTPLAPPPTAPVSTPPAAAPLPPPPAATPYPPYSEPPPKQPPTAAFVPPELLARRRAAAPPSAPYQPIAGWSLAPAAPMGPPQPMAGNLGPATAAVPQAGQPQTGQPQAYSPSTQAYSPSTQANGIQTQPTGPTNGFATPPPGATAPTGPAPTQGPPAPGAPGRSAGTGGGAPRRSPLLLAVAGIVVVALMAVVGYVVTHQKQNDEATGPKATPSASAAAAAPVKVKDVKISSYDPTAPVGSGFTEKGANWATNTYNVANPPFAGLKKGVGLVLDLGSARAVTLVTFDAVTGPQTVQLRSADQIPSGDDNGKEAGETVSASGKTKLEASAKAGKHQYWMIWVTDPGPTRKAVIGSISVSASPSAS